MMASLRKISVSIRFWKISILIRSLGNIDINKEISENIDIDKISNRLEFGISNRASPV